MSKKEKSKVSVPNIRRFKISQLRPSAYNPRVISDEALTGLTNSIKRFGCVEPIVVNIRGGRNTIIGRHQRLKALQVLGAKECICVTVDYSKSEEKLLNLTLNNPLIQGDFLEKICDYISKMQEKMPDEKGFLDLRIAELRSKIEDNKPYLPDGQEYDENIETRNRCPKCGYEW